MAAIDDPRTLGRARLTFADEAEIDEFVATLERFERGEIAPDVWRVFRLTRGTYGQRQPDVSMVRTKIPQGLLTSPQLRALADVAERYSRGFGHVTTRQNMQFHFVDLHEVETVMRRLAEAGLTTREACGNSVRNITACPLAGVAEDELFDVTPYAEALTRHLLRHPLSASLPRKFKIAFEGCAEDHVATGINDIGFLARIGPDGERGFRVTAGGGTSTMATAGSVLEEFLPAEDLLALGEAIVRVFHRLGDFEHKQRNRMKFLIKSIGWERFEEEVARERQRIAGSPDRPHLPFDPESPPVEEAPVGARPPEPLEADIAERAASARLSGPGLRPASAARLALVPQPLGMWLSTNVQRQKQPGYSLVTARLPLGDITAEQLRIVADLAEAYGDGTVRTTTGQNFLFRWVHATRVVPLFHRLTAAGLGLSGAGTLADVTSCPGAESCRLAVTQSRGMGRELTEALESSPRGTAAITDADIRISGCPNGCGQHHIAAIGLQGSIRKVGGRAVPQYFVMVGGHASVDGVRFARLAAKVPARRVANAVERLAKLYERERRPGEKLADCLGRIDIDRIRTLLGDLERLSAEDAEPQDFVDLGETHAFQPEVMDGECSA
jgi:sulfite reductase (NADPH) hemoprotein beta-component